MKTVKIGVLAFHGDVIEHIETLKLAAKKLKIKIEVIEVRTKESLRGLNGLILPGGESTMFYKLCQKEGMWLEMKKIKNIMGTCAGAIMLAKKVLHKEKGQETLELMDIEIDRNAYGSQADSFETEIQTTLGKIQAVFIRAPKIRRVGKGVKILAKNNNDIIACEEKVGNKYYLAICFHPEMSSTLFHEYFLKQI